MIGKGAGWTHSFCLAKFFPDLTDFFKFHSQGALQHQSEDKEMKNQT
jgi:hypothetical protein